MVPSILDIAVTATTPDDSLAPLSNHGDWVDVAAKSDLVVDFRNAVPREENVWPL